MRRGPAHGPRVLQAPPQCRNLGSCFPMAQRATGQETRMLGGSGSASRGKMVLALASGAKVYKEALTALQLASALEALPLAFWKPCPQPSPSLASVTLQEHCG